MAIDTVRLRSPSISEALAQKLEEASILRQGIELCSGEVLYEMTSGELDGSYDSRIMFRVCREDWISLSGRPELHPCDPFVLVECSWPKVLHGQNVFGQIDRFQDSSQMVLDVIEHLLQLEGDHELPSAKYWEVRRVDWAEMFDLPFSAISEFFRGFSACKFPRRSRSTAKHGEHSMHFPGSSTTLRLYHKGPEFKEHDLSRLRLSVMNYFLNRDELRNTEDINRAAKRKIQALQRLADRRLRCEVQINAPKLQYDFAELLQTRSESIEISNRELPVHQRQNYIPKFPFVSDITDEYLMSIYDREMFKLLKEGKTEMETVRNHDTVRVRLLSIYGNRSAKSLIAFWMIMAGQGEDIAKSMYSESQYYSNRSKLIEAGVSWYSSNVFILPPGGQLPVDFQPVRSDLRRCIASVRKGSIFNLHPQDYQLANLAA